MVRHQAVTQDGMVSMDPKDLVTGDLRKRCFLQPSTLFGGTSRDGDDMALPNKHIVGKVMSSPPWHESDVTPIPV